ncbi:MAG: tRNA (N6-isopentenyl adenosine(37)-C2)-methylthiotransferase MiaB [Clostridia bacterium]|nr:tRNA (N6-isopentenyl adenosine(37)-C2)-methylthiotransferase MiaB [Clostridia bacterium]
MHRESGRVGDHAPKYFIQTFGCQQNEADSERLAGLCRVMGYEPVFDPKDADLILVNTCAVREHAEKKAFSIIGQYKHIREVNPDLIIGVGGCMVTQKSRAEQFKKSYPYVSFTFDTGAIQFVPTLVLNKLTNGARQFIHSDAWKTREGVPIQPSAGYKAWLSIMYGCNNFCSYCIVPYVRGRERSRDAEDVLEEAKKLIAGGAKDITLLGQNVNSYKGGSDCDIAELMHRICALEGDFRLRFMTSHPKDASDRLIEAMASEEKIVKHFHLPVQSGSDRILAEMNRKYTAESYLEKIAKLKAAVPDVSITSDFIIGFPGETEEDFEATLELMKQVRYDMVYSFIFSPRQGTPAAKMDNQVPHEVSTERMARFLALEDEIRRERNARFIGKTLRVLVEGESKQDKALVTGRGDPVIPVHFPGDVSLTGQYVDVKITSDELFCFIGERV